MENPSKTRTAAAKQWVKDPFNCILVLLFVFAIGVRLYYFDLTINQPLWWDEAEYMSTAVHWAFDVPYEINPQRPPLFQLLASLIFMGGLGEQAIRFFLVVVPSICLVFAVYLLGKEMFNKKIGIIAAILTSVSWTLVFWTARVQPDFASMTFQVLSILFMWKLWKSSKYKYAVLAGVFAALGFLFKVSGLLVPISFIVFILVKDRISAIKNRQYWVFAASLIATLIPYFIWSKVMFGTFFGFATSYSNAIGQPIPFGWYNLNFFYSLTENLLFILFLLGLIISLKFLLYLDLMLKDKQKAFSPELFSIIVLAVVSSFYIFYIRGTEDRWVFLWLPFIFFFAGKAIETLYNVGKKYSKGLAIILVILVFGFIVYAQLNHANDLIKNKESSYIQVKQAALWLKENSQAEDKVISRSITQTTYYAERKVINYPETQEELEQIIQEQRPRFIEISIFEPHPDWAFSWIENNDRLTPVQGFLAPDGSNAILVLYEISY